MSKQDLKGKEEYQDIVLELMKYAGYIAIDKPGKFPHAIEVVRDYMEIWGEDDKQFQKAISKEAISKAAKDMNLPPGTASEFKIAKIKLREIVKLFGRSGFIEAKRIEGVLDGKVLDRIAEFSKDKAD